MGRPMAISPGPAERTVVYVQSCDRGWGEINKETQRNKNDDGESTLVP